MFENITSKRKISLPILQLIVLQLNALNKQTIQDLNLALQNCEADSNTGVIILTGSGEKAFVAGADIKEFADFTIAEGGVFASHGQEILFDYVENFPNLYSGH